MPSEDSAYRSMVLGGAATLRAARRAYESLSLYQGMDCQIPFAALSDDMKRHWVQWTLSQRSNERLLEAARLSFYALGDSK